MLLRPSPTRKEKNVLPQSETLPLNQRHGKKKKTSTHVILLFVILVYACSIVLFEHNFILRVGANKRLLSIKNIPEKTCVITIAAMNKFGFVSNLYDSTMTNSPSIDCFVWFMGDSADPIDSFRISRLKEIKQAIKTKKNFQLITMKQMEESLENFSSHKFAFLYNLIELQNSLKPFAFQYALKELRANAVIFLSNEIWVTDSLEEIQYQLFHRSCVVTPHYSSPVPEDGKNQRDKYALAEGMC